jgi:Zn-dependent protease
VNGARVTATRKGSIRLFRVAGIDVFLHWSWLIVAIYQISRSRSEYSSVAWNIAEYLSLFLIVLMHEFGHALACRQTGGRADQILLWPLGGVAYVAPPQRPGAVLWSIAAGPLVNLVLVLPLAALTLISHRQAWSVSMPDLAHFVWMVTLINIILLIFNLLPAYPLDGGQILRAVLWYFVGKARSLFVAVCIGFAGAVTLAVLAVSHQSIWWGIMAFFIYSRCWLGWKQAQIMSAMARMPRRTGFACPSCHTAPPIGTLWQCSQCRGNFDTFETEAECPNCHARFSNTQCLDCGVLRPLPEWKTTNPQLARHEGGHALPTN